MSGRMTSERARSILRDVTFPGYDWLVDGGERTYLQATFVAPHCRTGAPEQQFTRKWYVSREATRSEVVQTAFKCVLTSLEHEAREVFKYRGQPIFGPHFDVDGLAALCIAHAVDERASGHQVGNEARRTCEPLEGMLVLDLQEARHG